MAGQTFAIQFAPETHDHIAAIERKYHRQIRDTIDQRLAHDRRYQLAIGSGCDYRRHLAQRGS
jgi:hypothetical protein